MNSLIRGHTISNKQTNYFPPNVHEPETLVKAGNSALLPTGARDQTVKKGGMIMMRLMLTT